MGLIAGQGAAPRYAPGSGITRELELELFNVDLNCQANELGLPIFTPSPATEAWITRHPHWRVIDVNGEQRIDPDYRISRTGGSAVPPMEY